MLLPASWPPRWAARMAVMLGWSAKLWWAVNEWTSAYEQGLGGLTVERSNRRYA
jgi:hypothetical protein